MLSLFPTYLISFFFSFRGGARGIILLSSFLLCINSLISFLTSVRPGLSAFLAGGDDGPGSFLRVTGERARKKDLAQYTEQYMQPSSSQLTHSAAQTEVDRTRKPETTKPAAETVKTSQFGERNA